MFTGNLDFFGAGKSAKLVFSMRSVNKPLKREFQQPVRLSVVMIPTS
jgi:hypothetical protein